MAKISIITINYNHKSGLERTMKSVLSQDCSGFEYVIVDGGSTDGSKEAIINHEPNPNILFKWVSEPDGGIYDAMNKGLRMSTGDYVLFLNSGDIFDSSHILSDVQSNSLNADLIVGRQYQIRNGRKRLTHRIDADWVNRQYLISNTLPHQATFIRRDMLITLGGYRLDYPIVADWIFWYDAIVNHAATIQCIPTIVATMEEEGCSGDIDQCRSQMAQFLHAESQSLSIEEWKERIEENAQAYQLRCATRSRIGRFLTRLAIFLNK